MRRGAQGLQNIVKQLLGSVRQGLPTPQLNVPARHGRRPCVSMDARQLRTRRTNGVRYRRPHSVRQPVSGNAVSGLLDDGALSPLGTAPLELPPSVSLLR